MELETAKRLETEVKRLQEAEALKGSSLQRDNDSLLTQARQFEQQMSAMQVRVEELNRLTENSQKEQADETLRLKAKNDQLEMLQVEVQDLRKGWDAEKERTRECEEELSRLQSTLELKMRDIADAEDARSRAAVREAEEMHKMSELEAR